MATENRWILDGVRLVDPANGVDEFGRLAVSGGRLMPADAVHGATILRLDGLVVAPGFMDLHVHLREPGDTAKEDIASGTLAAARGGFTTVVAMANTRPPIDSAEEFRRQRDRIREAARVRVLQTACLTRGRRGAEPTNAAALRSVGARALTDDGSWVADAGVMASAMGAAARAGIPVLDHCEDPALTGEGALHDGPAARKLGLPGKPSVSETAAALRDIALAEASGCRLHIQHVSAAEVVDWLRAARERGIAVSGEATPHHLFLTEEACPRKGTLAKMNPPLRSEADRQALLEAVRTGVIEVIATDHAPHTAEEKARPFADAPAGVVGLESAVPLCLTHLYHGGILDLSALVSRFTTGPRRVLGLPTAGLTPGAPADLTLLDLTATCRIEAGTFLSKAANTPFDGRQCRGCVAAAMVGGQWVWSAIEAIPAESVPILPR